MKNIIRIEKREKFTVILRKLFEDKRLKWSTRGILAYLLSKPDNWVLQIVDLKKNADLGRDAIYDRVKQAIEFGYTTRNYLRNENGRVYGVEYIVRGHPDKPYPEKPDTVTPKPEKPDTANPDISKDSVITNTKKTTTTTEPENSSSREFFFHSKITKLQKLEILKLLQSLDVDQAQDILYELSGFIDKDLVQKDIVSLAEGLVKRALIGTFNLRLGIGYKDLKVTDKIITKRYQASIDNVPKLSEVDLNNALVKKILKIQNGT